MKRLQGESLRKAIELIEPGHRYKWAVLVGLAAVAGVMETAGALLIFTLVASITAPTQGVDLPIVGDIRARFPGLSDNEFLVRAAILIGVFYLVRAIFLLLQAYWQNRVAQNAGARLATRLLGGYLQMPYAFHLQRNSAETIRNAHVSVGQVVQMAFIPGVLAASESFLVLGVLAALFLASPLTTTLAIVLLAPISLVLLRLILPRTFRLGMTMQETGRTTLQALQESMQGLREVKVFGRESFFKQRFAIHRAMSARAFYLRSALAEIPRVSAETTLVLLILVFLIVTVTTGRSLQEALAVLGLFAYAGLRIMPSLNRVIANVNSFKFGAPAVQDIHAELETFKEAAPVHGEAPDPLPFEREIAFVDVSFAYDTDRPQVLDDLSFAIRRGEWVGIVGSTGAGKSTVADILLGLLTPTGGDVAVDGVSIHEHVRAWQGNLGMVPQTMFLLDDSLKNNIAFGVEKDFIDDTAIARAVEMAQLSDLIESLPQGLDTVVGERGVRLSGGQRQRVAIARALYGNPQVLIFDEATSALDNVTEAELIDGLEALHGAYTLIMIAHRLTTVRRCDRIMVLDRGRQIDTGTFDELLARNPLFEEMTR
ncbi:MAG: ABC transporter ATP-binding protein [Actinomycetota bacterium]